MHRSKSGGTRGRAGSLRASAEASVKSTALKRSSRVDVFFLSRRLMMPKYPSIEFVLSLEKTSSKTSATDCNSTSVCFARRPVGVVGVNAERSRVHYNSASLQFRKFTIPQLLVSIPYLLFDSRWFSTFGPSTFFAIREVSIHDSSPES